MTSNKYKGFLLYIALVMCTFVYVNNCDTDIFWGFFKRNRCIKLGQANGAYTKHIKALHLFVQTHTSPYDVTAK